MITERTLQSVIIAFLFCINGDKKYPDVKQKYRFELFVSSKIIKKSLNFPLSDFSVALDIND